MNIFSRSDIEEQKFSTFVTEHHFNKNPVSQTQNSLSRRSD
jgi:hypothetical protein